jgi:zinc-finger of transposase IS204/IS1001/IS1096/IS1165
MRSLEPSSLVPPGLVVVSAAEDQEGVLLSVRSLHKERPCPKCGTVSRRVHSRYSRRLADLPMSGRIVQFVVLARRFHCDAELCVRRIFAERFGADILRPWGRRTARLDHIVHHLALALGGRPAAGFARRLMIPVSNDTLLRVIRRRGTR